MAMDEKGLGKRLQAARVNAGMTQQALCQEAGLSYSTLTKIERGAIKSPSIFTIQSIAAALNLSFDDLLGHMAPKKKQKHRSKSGVSFVYFDINGCLVSFYHRAFTRLAEASGAPEDIIEGVFWRYNDQVSRGEMPLAEFNKELAKAVGMKEVDWMEYYLEAIDPNEQMQEVVRWASENYQVGLLTNIMPGFVDAMIHRGILPNVPYSAIIDSSVVGVLKPEAQIYEIATEKAGCPASEILVIEDERANLMAAGKFGWHVLWFDDNRIDDSIFRIKSALEIAEN